MKKQLAHYMEGLSIQSREMSKEEAKIYYAKFDLEELLLHKMENHRYTLQTELSKVLQRIEALEFLENELKKCNIQLPKYKEKNAQGVSINYIEKVINALSESVRRSNDSNSDIRL